MLRVWQLEVWVHWFAFMFSIRFVSDKHPTEVSHHAGVPPPLVILFHLRNILMEPFTMFIRNIPYRFSGKKSRWLSTKCILSDMRQPSSWYASSNSCTINALLSALKFPRKLAQICVKAFQARSSLTSRVDTDSVSRSTSRIWGPTKMPSLI